MSASGFRELSAGDQKAVVVEALAHRLTLSNNLKYEIDTVFHNHAYRGGVIGEAISGSASRSRIRHWRLNASYRMDTDRSPQVDASEPAERISSAYDANEGIARSTLRLPTSTRSFGRIDVVHDPVTEMNRYAYWLDGKDSGHGIGEFIFRYLLDHQDEIVIEPGDQGDTVVIRVPWQPASSDKPLGERVFVLDPSRGWLPVEGQGRWEQPEVGNWRFEEFQVEESRLVGDLWMPIRLREVIGASPLGPEKVAVYETVVLMISQGDVTSQDVSIGFPEGMEIIDAIRGVHYVVDAEGKPVGPEQSVMGRVASTEPRPAAVAESSMGRSLVLVNIGLALVVASVFLLRRGRPQ